MFGHLFRFSHYLVLTIVCLSRVHGFTDVAATYPAMSMEYKVFVDAGKEDCVFQYIHDGAVFMVDFQVISGGDGKAHLSIKDPKGVTLLPYEFTQQANYTTENAVEGYYALCVDNESKYSAKLMGIFIHTYEAEGWERFLEDIKDISISGTLFTQTLAAVDQRISQVLLHLHESKSSEARDFALLNENYSNINFWSLVQLFIILASGSTHVYIIRKFFQEAPSPRKFKVRA